MKKILCAVLVSAMLAAMTGCNEAASGSTGTSSGTASAEVNSSIDAGRLTSDYDGLVAAFTPLIRSYYDGIAAADYDASFAVFPDFYRAAVDRECTAASMTHEAYSKAARDTIVKTCGEDFKTTFTYETLYQLTDESLTAYEAILKNAFEVEVTLEDAYSVCITETTKGSLSTTSYDLEWFVFQIDGKLYLYESYYESV